MSYQQPPGGYPPQQGYPQQAQQPASQGYAQPGYAMPQAAGGGIPAGMVTLVGWGLIVLGGLLRSITGFMDPGKGMKNIYAVANLFLGLGLFALAFGLCTTALKDKEVGNSVKVAVVIAFVIVLMLALGTTMNMMAGRFLPDF